ncbi:hypothetical protein NDS46_31135 (plasmid) [Paenibacillus thiaminolyticus]|uniref:hypothetical protein n=1 Tax=Paenibacillus thiaminolyticus TaxID=49283 RepID=UPI00232B07BC|nr:hypothetical protein [Paenibacillus thiaminolyticus]WCF11413.1 hypothetical protein NDS46_31135 [Paenibacillus thiaminolyticus]
MIYVLFFIIWIGVLITVGIQIQAEKPIAGEPEFPKPIYRYIYRLSFAFPFKWFVDDDNNLTKKGSKLQEQLKYSGYDSFFTVRSFMAFKAMILLGSLFIGSALIVFLNNMDGIISVVSNVESNVGMNLKPKTIIMILCVCLLIGLMPNIRLKSKAKRALVEHSKDLPMIQMFTILMLRSNKTVSEILFALSKLNTKHREIFERGYRMYLRNKNEGLAYLRSSFDNERFIEMFNLLEDIAEYAREECIQIMESNMKSLINDINTIKRKNDLSKLVYSQASMIVPFSAILLLGAVPIIVMGLSILSGTMNGFQ